MITLTLKQSLLALVALAVTCHAAPPTAQEVATNTAQGLRLIEVEAGVDPVWMTREQRFELVRADKNFFDVTETYEPPLDAARLAGPKPKPPTFGYPRPSKQPAVNRLIEQLSIPNMQSYLSNLTSFHTRYYESETGVAASHWIRDTIAQIIKSNPRTRASVSLFKHSFPQSSIVARFPGRNDRGPVTVLGAHMDSINGDDPLNGRSPGADDDGTGSMNLIEIFRVLAQGGFQPETPVEFHWYAGEEMGLLGSQDIAKSYAKKGVAVKGMLQLDMTAYHKPGTREVISLIPDFTNSNLTSYIGTLVDAYSKLPWVINDPCGYACSDHASWERNGYPSAFPFEGTIFADMDPLIHTADDTVDVEGFSWTHSLEFAKVGVAFAYELSA